MEATILAGFAVGLFVGTTFGVICMALMNAASAADDEMENRK